MSECLFWSRPGVLGDQPGISVQESEATSGRQAGGLRTCRVEAAVLPGLVDAGGREPQQQRLDVSPASGQGQDILLPLSCSGLALGS